MVESRQRRQGIFQWFADWFDGDLRGRAGRSARDSDFRQIAIIGVVERVVVSCRDAGPTGDTRRDSTGREFGVTADNRH